MLASSARSLHHWSGRLADRLHLRGTVRWTMRHAPGWLRVRVNRMLLRVGYDSPVIYTSRDALQRCLTAALALLPERRVTYLEFGVYVGTSMIAMHRAARADHRSVTLVGFDSFQGLPASAGVESDGVWHKGQYHADIDLTRTNLRRHGVDPDEVRLVPGWFEDSLTQETRESLGVERVDIVMIDCDLESSTRMALDFCAPLIGPTIIFLDDWDIGGLGDRGLGEARAFEAWRASHPELEVVDRPELRYHAPARAFLVTRRAGH
jgi:predicted O-methyltransferase YrrM